VARHDEQETREGCGDRRGAAWAGLASGIWHLASCSSPFSPQALFASLDKDKDGMLSLKEMNKGTDLGKEKVR
jgi:hypothetical protein